MLRGLPVSKCDESICPLDGVEIGIFPCLVAVNNRGHVVPLDELANTNRELGFVTEFHCLLLAGGLQKAFGGCGSVGVVVYVVGGHFSSLLEV